MIGLEGIKTDTKTWLMSYGNHEGSCARQNSQTHQQFGPETNRGPRSHTVTEEQLLISA
jgi:hypothetical protein